MDFVEFLDFMDFVDFQARALSGPCLLCRPSLHSSLSLQLLPGGSPKVVFLLLLIWTPLFSVAGAVSHGPRLVPRDARDRTRAQSRSGLELPTGRPVLGKTQENRDKLLGVFDEWLGLQGLSLNILLGPGTPDIELINLMLEKYGRELRRAGRPYGHYAETVNGVAARRPLDYEPHSSQLIH